MVTPSPKTLITAVGRGYECVHAEQAPSRRQAAEKKRRCKHNVRQEAANGKRPPSVWIGLSRFWSGLDGLKQFWTGLKRFWTGFKRCGAGLKAILSGLKRFRAVWDDVGAV